MTKFWTDIIFRKAAQSFIDSGYELFSFSGLFNLKCCQQTFKIVVFCSKVGIIRNEILFFGFYRCVNSGESLTNWIKPEGLYVKYVSDSPAKKLNFIPITRNIFKKDIQRHSKENIHLKSCCNWKMFFYAQKTDVRCWLIGWGEKLKVANVKVWLRVCERCLLQLKGISVL